MVKIILTPELEQRVSEIMAPLEQPEKWKSMKIPFAPSPSAVVLLTGIPGTGKSTLAANMAQRLHAPPLQISFQNVANPQLGETERKIKSLFDLAHEQGQPTIHLEECDSILWSRDMIDKDNVHQLGFVNTLLTEIDKLLARDLPTLILLSTNYSKLLDTALLSRITDTIELFSPIGAHAQRMWKSKIPGTLKPTKEDLEWLSLQPHTPREMENRIRKACRHAMTQNHLVTMEDIRNVE